MSSPSAPFSRASATRKLDEIRQVLAQTVAAALERERAVSVPAADPATGDREESLRRLFDQPEARLRACHECIERADRDAGEAYAALADREDALGRWLAAAAVCRQKLADWAARAI